ncbi:acidic leucine-rich nuclear phosphoprotein 32-related protein 1-like isoform X2 [Zingiber officinale]|uniref:acidic leucine-rich nuclear phosphoprotein 32-related protein 1-like isoform X2 n=1 Tax=Zingiber officinale TaxID=94328 RepID=UPI001C4CCA5B|nr:acidic leucine-rich nuclear phosphoprotein 32-related protein 1-like isoform X2 [Zingiber officinale]
MDEAWERAVEAAIGAQEESSASPPRSLTLDGSVKCCHGQLPPPEILERYQSLEVLSIANIGVSSLEKFPRLQNLHRLILSDNRIGGGLEFLVDAGLDSLRDLDLSNNRIQFLEDLSPLAQLRLVSLDLYECPVTRIKDYRSRVFGMIRTLKYLDKLDTDENERSESDEEDEEEEEDEDDEDPGSGEVDGEEHAKRLMNGSGSNTIHAIDDVDQEEESDAEEEDIETGVGTDANGSERGYHASNGFRVASIRAASVEDEEEDDVDEYDEVDLGEEIDAEDDDDDDDDDEEEEDDIIEDHDIEDNEDDDDGVEEGEEELDEEDKDAEDGDVEEDQDVPYDNDGGGPGSLGRFINVEGEIDGHEQGEGDEDENGEIGQEDAQDVDDDRFSEEGDGEDEFEVSKFKISHVERPKI